MMKSEVVKYHTSPTNTLFWRHKTFDAYQTKLVCLCICRQLSIFRINSSRIRPIKLKLSMLYITSIILYPNDSQFMR